MNDKTGKLLVVESDDALREQIVAVLSGAGYEVSTDYREGMKAVLAFDPDAVVLGADPPQLDCCGLLSEIKSSERTHDIRVVMLSPGGSAERTRGLDLGADDVLSLPFDSHELLARVRSQVRSRYVADEFRERLRLAEENRDGSQRRTADASGWRPGGCCRADRCWSGLFLLLPAYPGTKYPGLCCHHSTADWRFDGTEVDGALPSSP